MAFPTDPLGTTVEFQIGGVWTDITPYAYLADPIAITHGRADQAARVDPGACKITLNNTDGRFSPRNPMSPYYGLIGRNTPVRVSVRAGGTYLGTTGTTGSNNGASTPDTAALDITGDLDVRFDAILSNWLASGSVELCGKGLGAGNRSWLLLMRDRRLHFEWSAAGTNTAQADSTVEVVVPPSERLAVRVTLDVDNGAGGSTVTFWTSNSLSGTWTQLGNPIVTAGVTSIFNSTAVVRVGDGWGDLGFPNSSGRVLAFELRNGINGTVVANPDFTVQTAGATSFTDATGKVWTVGNSTSLTNRRTRFVGEISSWPVTWGNGSGMDVRTSVTAAGILRRLGQGSSPLQSTLRRRIPSDSNLLAYWPMEEAAGATQAYSPLKGIRPMRTSGLTFGADDSLPGSSPLPTLATGATIAGQVPGGSGNGWHVEMVYKLGAMPVSTTSMFKVNVGGSTVSSVLVRPSASAIRIELHDSDDTVLQFADYSDPNALAAFWGDWCRLQIYTRKNGTSTDFYAQWIKIDTNQTWFVFTTATSTTPGNVTSVTTTANQAFDGMPIGHIAAFNSSDSTIYNSADHGFNGETAGTRMGRLAGEEGIPLTVYGDPSGQAKMGPQRPAAILDLLGDAGDADSGILYERRGSVALAYRDLNGLYNQPIGLALDYTAKGHVAPPLQPTDDDQGIHNDITVTRVNGSSARATLDVGPLSTQAPPDGVGPYAGNAVTLNLFDDSQPEQQAGWRLHLGTWDEARYPSVKVNLAKAPGLIDAATALDSGDLISVTNLPSWLPPDDLLLMVQGYTETIGVRTWDIVYNCTPGGPWTVAERDDTTLARRDTDSSSLAAAATSTDTTLSVATTSGPAWTTDPTDTPFDIAVGGEVMTVTTVGSVLNSNPFFVTDVSSWTGTGATILWNTGRVYPGGGAVASLQITPNGTSASGGANCAQSAVSSITPGADYTASMWAYCSAGLTDARACIDWYDATGTFISSSLGVATVLPAATWTMLQQTLTAPASASRAVLRARHAGTPSAGTLWNIWAARLVPVASYNSSPQTMTVVRSVNGISKAQSAGTAVSLAHPATRAL